MTLVRLQKHKLHTWDHMQGNLAHWQYTAISRTSSDMLVQT